MRLLELLWLVMVIRIRNTRLEMIKVKMVIVNYVNWICNKAIIGLGRLYIV
jgi:hypothetical protein